MVEQPQRPQITGGGLFSLFWQDTFCCFLSGGWGDVGIRGFIVGYLKGQCYEIKLAFLSHLRRVRHHVLFRSVPSVLFRS